MGLWNGMRRSARRVASDGSAARDEYPTLLARADAARDRGDWAVAADAYEAALAVRPDEAAIWVQLGNMSKDAKDFVRAHLAYGRALDLQANNADTHLQVGHLHKVQGNNAEAKASYLLAKRFDPSSKQASVELRAVQAAIDASLSSVSARIPVPSSSLPQAAPSPSMSNYKTQDLRSAVADIYRAILQRDPHSAEMDQYSVMLQQQGLRRVIEAFLACEEYRTLSPSGPMPELNWQPKMPVQLCLSDVQLDQLWDHVSQVWTGLGASEPFWSVFTNERYRKANMSDAAVVEEFYASGVGDVSYLRAYLDRAGLALTQDMLVAEYGCGSGRVTPFLARACGRVLAFDISAPHLQVARLRLAQEGISNVEFIHVSGRPSLTRLTGVDLFFSIIVLQHNPPPIILDILQAAFAGLRPGGLAFFQVPTYASQYAFELEQFLKNEGRAKSMEMHFVPQQDILQLAKAHGMQLIEVRTDHLVGNYERWLSNTFLMQKE